MRPTIPAVVFLAFALSSPAAAADREGLLVGFTTGFGGSNDCDQCELGIGFAFGVHAGATVAKGLAVVGEGSMLAYAEAPEGAGNFSLVGGAQYFPIPWVFVGAAAGVGTTGGAATDYDTGPIVVAQAGLDFRGRKRFGFDVRGRYERRVDETDGGRALTFLLGFTWY